MQEFGISAALVTPFAANGAPDLAAFARHARAVLERGADGITLFGTTGEGASLGLSERLQCLGALRDENIAREKITVGLCATSIEDLLTQANAAADHGYTKVLMPPPFYFKAIDDQPLFEWYLSALAGLSDEMRVILYHIPQITEVPLSPGLVRRLRDAAPKQVVAIKDSAGNWQNTHALLKEEGLAVLVGDERHLAPAARLGCAGSISGLANVVPQRLRRVLDAGVEDPAVNALVEAVLASPVTPAVKVLVSDLYKDAGWRRVRPPFAATPDAAVPALQSALALAMQTGEV